MAQILCEKLVLELGPPADSKDFCDLLETETTPLPSDIASSSLSFTTYFEPSALGTLGFVLKNWKGKTCLKQEKSGKFHPSCLSSPPKKRTLPRKSMIFFFRPSTPLTLAAPGCTAKQTSRSSARPPPSSGSYDGPGALGARREVLGSESSTSLGAWGAFFEGSPRSKSAPFFGLELLLIQGPKLENDSQSHATNHRQQKTNTIKTMGT